MSIELSKVIYVYFRLIIIITKTMNRYTRITIIVVFTIILLLGIWYFSGLVAHLIIALVLAIVGRPLANKIQKIKIKLFQVNSTLAAALTLLVEISVVIILIAIFIPIVTRQAEVISNIDTNKVSANLISTVHNLDKTLTKYGMISADEPIEVMVENKVAKLVNVATFSSIAEKLLSFTGSFFIGLFSVLFMAFFFLKDENLFKNILLMITPVNHAQKIDNIIIKTKHLLTRYFIGLLIEIGSMITLITIGLLILGVQSPVLIGFFGGTMNVIPYLGPVIGAAVGSVIAMLGELGTGNLSDFYLSGGKVAMVFLAANLVDNVVLQPLIYSNSVKAHPLEIFIVIMMAGTLGGVAGMILAIPAYTVLRIVAGEFLGEFKLVQELTRKI